MSHSGFLHHNSAVRTKQSITTYVSITIYNLEDQRGGHPLFVPVLLFSLSPSPLLPGATWFHHLPLPIYLMNFLCPIFKSRSFCVPTSETVLDIRLEDSVAKTESLRDNSFLSPRPSGPRGFQWGSHCHSIPCSPVGDTPFLSGCFQDFFLVIGFQKFHCGVSRHGCSGDYLTWA